MIRGGEYLGEFLPRWPKNLIGTVFTQNASLLRVCLSPDISMHPFFGESASSPMNLIVA